MVKLRLAVFTLGSLLATAAVAGDRLLLDTLGTEDSDGLRQHVEYVGLRHALPAQGRDAHVDLRAGYWHLAAPGDLQEDFTVLRLDHERAFGAVATTLRLQQLVSEDWSPTLGGLGASWQATPRWSLAAGADADIVDTALAAQHEIRVDTYNLSGDYRIGAAFTLAGSLLQQDFSDGNRREGGRLRIAYAPPMLEGFNAQLRLRRLDGDFRGIGYFSPDRFEDVMLQLQYGHALPGGRFNLTGIAGGGGQRIDGGATTSVFLAELRTRGWFTDQLGLEGKAGCSNSGDLNVRAASGGYRYCYANVTLLRAL
jgi:hypothetical protein